MSDKKKSGSGKGRKPGEWKNIAAGRERNKNREIRWTNGYGCIPAVTDTGSAAYRRLLASTTRRGVRMVGE